MTLKRSFLSEWNCFKKDLEVGDLLCGNMDPFACVGSIARMLFVLTIYAISFIPCTIRNCVYAQG